MAILGSVKSISLPHISLPGSAARTPTSSNTPSRATSPIRTKHSPPSSTLPSPTKARGTESLPFAAGGDKDVNNNSTSTTKERRSSVSAMNSLGAALGLRRSTSTSTRTASSGGPTPAATPPISSSRPVSDSSVGLVPLSSVAPSVPVGTTRHSSHSRGREPSSKHNARASSASRAHHLSPLSTNPGTLPLTQSHSQPPLLRRTTGGTVSSTGGTGSGRATPGGPPSQAGAHYIHNLEESYAGKVSLKLSDAVNKVFLSGEKGSVVNIPGLGTPRAVPSATKAKEVGDIVTRELYAALSDHYLLRNILRSSILKTLSVFLTRLSALLLPPTAYIPNPTLSLPASLSYNLQVVRCAYELKTALKHLRLGGQMPPGIGETLRPWEAKLEELMARVLSPLVVGIKEEVGRICENGRRWDRSASQSTSAVGGVAPALAKGGLPGTAQLRSLATGSPVPAGPFWIKELSSLLEGTAKLILKLNCDEDKDHWLCSVGAAAVWKGILAMSARRMDDMPAPTVSGHSIGTAAGAAAAASAMFSKAKMSSKGSSPPLKPVDLAATPSAHSSTVNLAHGTSIVASTTEDLAFVRFLAELELFEAKITSYISLISSCSLDTSNILLSGTCANIDACGLCKTGRSFDAESSDSDDENVDAASGLSQYALREATQTLSALIVLVRAYRVQDGQQLREALETMIPEDEEDEDQGESAITIKPLMPLALLSATAPVPPAVLESLPDPVAPTGPAICPTLSHALDTLPSIILFQTLASRLPASLGFLVPHEIWGLDWAQYEKELRSFAAGEEWAAEIGWEMGGEVARIQEEMPQDATVGKTELAMLARAVKVKVGSPIDGI